MDVASLQDFLRRERRSVRDEAALLEMLSEEARVDRGDVLTGLWVRDRQPRVLRLRCDVNESRFRPGMRLELSTSNVRVAGAIVDITDQGRMLEVRADRQVAALPDGPWTAREADIDLSFVISQCLGKLQPGAPGWAFFNSLVSVSTSRLANTLADAASEVIERVIADAGRAIDVSQRAVLEHCASLPSLLAIQGPPGTGKTTVLALVAETLARLGKRVLLVAPTHQAVNNSLTAIHRAFPARMLVKAGDELRRESLDENIDCRPARDATAGVPAHRQGELIIGMTFLSALHHQALRSTGLSPNVVLIDEAGQLPLAQGACAGLFGAGVILLFGDDAQLPPVFAGDLAEDPLAVSLFKRVRQIQPDLVMRLNTTYRMNRDLCCITAKEFYASGSTPLEPSPAVAGKRLELRAGEHLAGLPTDVLAPEPALVWLKTPDRSSRQANSWEADAVANVIAACLKRGKAANDVAVVTPFRRQAALIRQRLQTLMAPADSLPIIDTVERVQGMTVDLVAISMTASDPDFVASIAGFLFSANRLNVAISRARTKVVLACSPSVFEPTPSDYAAFLGQQRLSRILNQCSSPSAGTRLALEEM